MGDWNSLKKIVEPWPQDNSHVSMRVNISGALLDYIPVPSSLLVSCFIKAPASWQGATNRVWMPRLSPNIVADIRSFTGSGCAGSL